ncbi:MAG: hypothetical protein GF344_02540, partial [Chitinivibrionales bacterium]|nr:hypothetical protein [Chitinivibrionales bacterium]MBD3355965.1 hypothetical protein [Chitinivibrionales bacterium]
MKALLLSNYHFFICIFTGLYCLAFILVLANRYQYSAPARSFASWLFFVFIWSARESLTTAFLPYLDTQALLKAVVSTSPLYLVSVNFAFHVLISIHNAQVSGDRKFNHEKTVQIALGILIAVFYATSLIDPKLLYSSFDKGAYDYHYQAGPLMLAFILVQFIALGWPAVMLIRDSRAEPHSEALIVGIGSLLALGALGATTFVPNLLGFTHLPRLGVLAVSFPCAAAFAAIQKYGRTFAFGRVLDELKKAKLIGKSLRGLVVGTLDEDTIFQNICDSAQEISDSLFVCVVIFDMQAASYEVRGVSRATDTLKDTVFGRLPLSPGTKYPLSERGVLAQQI